LVLGGDIVCRVRGRQRGIYLLPDKHLPQDTGESYSPGVRELGRKSEQEIDCEILGIGMIVELSHWLVTTEEETESLYRLTLSIIGLYI